METIHIQSFVAASPGEVWAALLGRPEVVLDALPARAWPEPREERAPASLHVRWLFTEACGAATELVIRLDEVSGGTRVDVRHEGFGEGPAWAEALAGHFAGWLQALAALGLLVENGTDARPGAALAERERYYASAEIRAPTDAVYRSLVDPDVLAAWSNGVLDGARVIDEVEGRYVRWQLPGGTAAREVVMLLRRTPRGTHVALAEYGVADRSEPSGRWPPMFERLSRFLG